MLPEVTLKLRPPRALAVPYPLGFPLGSPAVPDMQLTVLRSLLRLCQSTEVPVLEDLAQT